MLGIAELLGHEDLTNKQRQLLSLLQQSGDSLLDILNSVLDYSRIEASRLELNEQPFNVLLLLQKVQALHQWSAETKSLRLEVSTENLADDFLLGDSVRLEQVLSNLLSNAIKFTASGTIKLSATSEQLSGRQVRLRFEVADTGIGIDSRDVKALFIPFSQASSQRRVQTGTGLELSISKALVELMGGAIGVESAVNQGSLFWVEVTLSSTAGNPNLFLKLLRIFCAENQGLSAMLIDEIQKRDYSRVMRRLHNLKGAARYIGALEIERFTEELESFIAPCVVSRIPLPSSSQVYPIIADVQQAVLNLAKQLEAREHSLGYSSQSIQQSTK